MSIKNRTAVVEETVIKESTCIENGIVHQVWTVPENPDLNREFDAVKKPLDHEYELFLEAIEPTCSSIGYTETFKCKMCGTEKGHEEISKEWCTFEYVDAKDPTCTSSGNVGYSCCVICGRTSPDKVTIDPIGHSISEEKIEAGYLTYGYIRHYCSRCDYEYLDTFIDPIIQKKFYYNYEDGCIIITGLKDSNITYLNLPQEIEVLNNNQLIKVPVRKIADYAFDETDIEQVYFPESITEIGEYAFAKCKSLKEIILPCNLTVLEKGAFSECSNLQNIQIPSSLAVIEESAFSRCSSLEHLEIPNNVREISGLAFYNCYRLKEVSFSEGLEVIGGNAFSDCSSLRVLDIPFSVREISMVAFQNLNNLVGIFDPNNLLHYSVAQGVQSVVSDVSSSKNIFYQDDFTFVYNFNNDSYLLVNNKLSGEEVIFPTSFNGHYYYLVKGSLSNLKDVKKLTLCGVSHNNFMELFADISISYDNGVVPSNLTEISLDVSYEIPKNYFKDCQNLKKIVFSKNVLGFGKGVLSGCSSLEALTLPIRKVSLSYIFGMENPTDSSFIPSSLKIVTINDGDDFSVISNYFTYCETLETINLCDSILEIKSNAFKNCNGIEEITLPSNLLKIEENAFINCVNLKTINNPSNLVIQSGSSDHGSVAINAQVINELPKALIEIQSGDFAYYKNKNTNEYLLYKYMGTNTNVILPESVEGFAYSVTKYAFYNNDFIKSIEITGEVLTISSYAFYDCDLLETVYIDAGINQIKQSTFEHCDLLNSVTYINDVEIIENRAFMNCKGLELISFGNHLKSLEEFAFAYCSSLKSFNFGQIKIIPNGCFRNCTSLETIVFPDTLEVIYIDAFYFLS